MTVFLFYLLSVFTLFILGARDNSILNNQYSKKVIHTFLVFITFSVIIYVDLNFSDRVVYSRIFRELRGLSFKEVFNLYSHEPLFLFVTKLVGLFAEKEITYYIIIYSIFLLVLSRGLKLIMNNNSLYAFIIFLNFATYYGYILNGLRQGMAMALVVLAIGYAVNNKSYKMFIASICAFLFHYSCLPIVFCIIFLHYVKRIKNKYFLILYSIFFILYITGFNQTLFSNLSIDSLDDYTDSNLISYFGGSNKVKFLLFNTFFLVLFSVYLKAFEKKMVFEFLYKCYILFSVYFMAFGFIAFANRISAYSWFLIPIILGLIMARSKNKLFSIVIVISAIIIGYLSGVHLYYIGQY